MKITPFIFILLFITLKGRGQDLSTGHNGNISDDNGNFYWIGTTIFSAINVTTTTFNIIKLKRYDKPDKYKSNAILGIISGSVQTSLGVFSKSETFKNAYIPISINIGIGLATIATSVIRLTRKNPPKDTKISYNFFYLPPIEGEASKVGFCLIRKID